MPCHHSANKHPLLPSDQRLKLLQLATESVPQLAIETHELNATQTTFTVETLTHLKQKYPERILLFIIGSDALNNIDQWHQWQHLLTLCHLVVVQRPNHAVNLSSEIVQWLRLHQVEQPKSLFYQPHGCVWCTDVASPDIASSHIRQLLNSNPASAELARMLPTRVADYIFTNQLYQTAV